MAIRPFLTALSRSAPYGIDNCPPLCYTTIGVAKLPERSLAHARWRSASFCGVYIHHGGVIVFLHNSFDARLKGGVAMNVTWEELFDILFGIVLVIIPVVVDVLLHFFDHRPK